MMVKKTRGTMLVGVFMLVGISMMNRWMMGTVAAKLPFEPWGFVQGITHYGIENPDITLCSVTFIFVLS